MIGRVCVTGGAGFIGSHMVDRLLAEGCAVTVVDNFRTGRREFLNVSDSHVVECDITRDQDKLIAAIDGADWVCHFAANADARGERRGVQFNLEQNITGTANVLDAMLQVGTTRILYASTASIYGNTEETPTPEDFRLTPQASFYGASKLACEGLIGAYCEMHGFTGILGRWVHILGERYLHGHIIDFLRKLRRNPHALHILGDGTQAKSGLHAANLCDGLYRAMQYHDLDEGLCEPYNFGGDTLLSVTESAELICKIAGVDPLFTYSGRKNGGWVGDNAHLVLDSSKARGRLGWSPTVTVPEGIELTARWLLEEASYL